MVLNRQTRPTRKILHTPRSRKTASVTPFSNVASTRSLSHSCRSTPNRLAAAGEAAGPQATGSLLLLAVAVAAAEAGLKLASQSSAARPWSPSRTETSESFTVSSNRETSAQPTTCNCRSCGTEHTTRKLRVYEEGRWVSCTSKVHFKKVECILITAVSMVWMSESSCILHNNKGLC